MALTASLIDCSAPQEPPIFPRGAAFARSGGAAATETLLHSFVGNSDGSYPNSSLVAVKALLFGTTSNGGSGGCTKVNGCGTVYTIDASGNETVVTTFKGGTDGEAPNQLLLDSDTTFYGTTWYGGSSGCTLKRGNTSGCGTVFQLSPSGSEKVIYRFPGGEKGALPSSGLSKFKSVFYGEAAAGGKGDCDTANQPGCGLIYSVTRSGHVKVIYTFAGGTDAGSPSGGLTADKGELYGTSTAGRKDPACGFSHGCGTVFKVTPSGKETVLHVFTGKRDDGVLPETGLVLLNGTFYGTTFTGGTYDCGTTAYFFGCGTIFEITPSGAEKTIHNFKGGSDGRYPSGLFVVNGVLYGTTSGGGDGCKPYGGCGTFFKMTASGEKTILYSFPGTPDVSGPISPFLYKNGTFYGVSGGGGSHALGTAFAVTL